MSLKPEHGDYAEKPVTAAPGYDGSSPGEHSRDKEFNSDPENVGQVQNKLHQDLKGRHMQMIAM